MTRFHSLLITTALSLCIAVPAQAQFTSSILDASMLDPLPAVIPPQCAAQKAAYDEGKDDYDYWKRDLSNLYGRYEQQVIDNQAEMTRDNNAVASAQQKLDKAQNDLGFYNNVVTNLNNQLANTELSPDQRSVLQGQLDQATASQANARTAVSSAQTSLQDKIDLRQEDAESGLKSLTFYQNQMVSAQDNIDFSAQKMNEAYTELMLCAKPVPAPAPMPGPSPSPSPYPYPAPYPSPMPY